MLGGGAIREVAIISLMTTARIYLATAIYPLILGSIYSFASCGRITNLSAAESSVIRCGGTRAINSAVSS